MPLIVACVVPADTELVEPAHGGTRLHRPRILRLSVEWKRLVHHHHVKGGPREYAAEREGVNRVDLDQHVVVHRRVVCVDAQQRDGVPGPSEGAALALVQLAADQWDHTILVLLRDELGDHRRGGGAEEEPCSVSLPRRRSHVRVIQAFSPAFGGRRRGGISRLLPLENFFLCNAPWVRCNSHPHAGRRDNMVRHNQCSQRTTTRGITCDTEASISWCLKRSSQARHTPNLRSSTARACAPSGNVWCVSAVHKAEWPPAQEPRCPGAIGRWRWKVACVWSHRQKRHERRGKPPYSEA